MASAPIETLTRYHRNARRGNVDRIAESLATLGQYRPIVVNRGAKTGRQNEVLAGNHTLDAAASLGWDEIEVHYVDVDDETATRIAVVDNRLNDVAVYDDEALAALIGDLPDLTATGWTTEEWDDFLANLAPAGEDDWAAAAGQIAEGDPVALTRTFTLTPDQAVIVDAAIDAALAALGDDVQGNRNGSALTHIAESFG